MKLMILEGAHQGHFLMFVRRLIDGLGPQVDSTVFLTEAGVPQTAEFRQHIEPVLERVTLDDSLTAPASGGSLRRYWNARLMQLADRIKHHKADHVIIPSGDGVAVYSGMMRLMGKRVPWNGLDVEIEANLIRTYVGYPVKGVKKRARQWLIGTALKRSPLRTVYTNDSVSYERLKRVWPGVAKRLELLPDPLSPAAAPGKMAAREKWGMPGEGRVVGMVGVMEPRKGVGRLLAAFRAAGLEGKDRLLLVGKFVPETRALLTEYADLVAAKRLFVVDRYVSDVEMMTALSAMDLVCTPYEEFLGLSGVALHAMAVDRPVLSTDYGWSGGMIPQFKMGWVCDTRDGAGFARELRVRLGEAAGFVPSEATGRLKKYLSVENYWATWARRIRERKGLGADAKLLTWDWVLGGK